MLDTGSWEPKPSAPGGDVPPLPSGLMPVFWACGVTPQSAAEAAGIEFMITHAPAHGFVTNIEADHFSLP